MSRSASGGSASGASARFSGDVEPPEGGGIFRRMAPSGGSSLGAVFGVVEGLFAPAAAQAREELQRQKVAGARNPSDTDPPDDVDDDDAPRVAAPGRPGTPFSGSILISRPEPQG